MIPTPTEFWSFNATRVGAVAGTVLASADGNDYYCDPGKIGQGWQFADMATERCLSAACSLIDIRQSFTVSLWYAKLNTGNVSPELVEFTDAAGTRRLRVRDTQTIFARKVDVTLEGNVVKSVTIAKNTTWHSVVVRYDQPSAVLSIFFDGAKSDFASIVRPVSVVAGIGIQHGDFTYNSHMDSIGVWQAALSDAEVAELYAAGAGWEYATPADNTPDAFAFPAVIDADPSTVYVSDSQTIAGMDAGTAVSITGGEYRLDGGAWTAEAGTINPGQTLELRATSSAESEGVVTVTITVGTVSVDWTLTTKLIASVVTTILWGSTPDTSRILDSRIVRGIV